MIRLKEFDHTEVERFCAFSRTYYDSPATTDPELIAWKFPGTGKFLSKHLTMETGEGRILGRAVLCRRPLTIPGRDDLCLNIPSDLLIDTGAAGAACLLQLVNAYPKLETDGLVHPSNEKSEAIYRRLFKFPVVGALKSVALPVCLETVLPNKAWLLPLRALLWLAGWLVGGAYAAILGPLALSARGLDLTEGPVNADAESLLRGFRAVAPVQVTRDRDFLAWRYAASPLGYRELAVRKGGEEIAKIVFRTTTSPGVTAMTVMDILVARRLTLAERARIVLRLRAIARKEGAALVYYLGNFRNPTVRHVAGVGFFTIPDRLLPHASPLFTYALRPPVNEEIVAGMYLTLGDLDYF